MANIYSVMHNLKLVEDYANKNSIIHRRHPFVKLMTTIFYLIVVVSYGKYQLSALLVLILYPVVVISLADIPVLPILKRVLLIEPLIIGIGIFNPLFDNGQIILYDISISRGWISFINLLLKGSLTTFAVTLLIATTGMYQLSSALNIIKVPEIFILQLLMTYRYIIILVEEVIKVLQAYSLRAPGEKGIKRTVWGSLIGQIVFRTYDRGNMVYNAMLLRGYSGAGFGGDNKRLINLYDFLYLLIWIVFFIVARKFNIALAIGLLFWRF